MSHSPRNNEAIAAVLRAAPVEPAQALKVSPKIFACVMRQYVPSRRVPSLVASKDFLRKSALKPPAVFFSILEQVLISPTKNNATKIVGQTLSSPHRNLSTTFAVYLWVPTEVIFHLLQ